MMVLEGKVPRHWKTNLEKTIDLAFEKNLKVILAGMKMPPNYGKISKRL